MRQLKYREVSWQAQKSMLKVVGLEFKCHWSIIRTRLWATKMFCFAQWEPQTWLLNWAIHLFFLSSVICKCKVESNFWELSYFLKYYYLQSFLPVLLNLWNLPSTKYIWFFPIVSLFLLPWGYNNFLSHFYNFHIINHFFLVVGRKSKTIVLVTSFIICHLSLSSIQYLWSRTNSFICISQLDFFPVKS